MPSGHYSASGFLGGAGSAHPHQLAYELQVRYMPTIRLPMPASEKRAVRILKQTGYSLVVIVLTFAVLCTVSFLSLRPILQDARADMRAAWRAFEESAHVRNAKLPKPAEAFRRHFPTQGELTEALLQSRTAMERASTPEGFAAAYTAQEQRLLQMEKIVRSRSELLEQTTFRRSWVPLMCESRVVRQQRAAFDNAVRCYNRLLAGFPQEIVAPFFGFFPLPERPGAKTAVTVRKK